MAVVKPLVISSAGEIQRLQAGDTISGASATITQVEVDFGATPVPEATFTVVDAVTTAASNIIASVAYAAPTGKDLDELEMDDLIIRAGYNGVAGQFDMFIRPADGGYVHDKYKINYLIS